MMYEENGYIYKKVELLFSEQDDFHERHIKSGWEYMGRTNNNMFCYRKKNK